MHSWLQHRSQQSRHAQGEQVSRSEKQIVNDVVAQLRNQARQASWATDPTGWARDVLGVHMWSKQQEVSRSLQDNKRTVVASCHGTGKALDVDTLIPTPDGFVRMGEIKVGSKVLGSDGKPVNVVATTGIHVADRYLIRFHNGVIPQEIIASGDHLWPVMNSQDRAMAEVMCGRNNLPMHTGLWAHKARTIDTRTIFDIFKSNARRILVPSEMPDTTLQGNPLTPDPWMQGLIRERLHTDVMGRAALTWTTHHTAQAPGDLVRARAWFKEHGIHTLLHRRRTGMAARWMLGVTGDSIVKLVENPDERAIALTHQLSKRGLESDRGWDIVSVRRIDDGEVQCIQVDAPDHLFLCGGNRIPTHNSMIASVLACWWISTRPLGEAIVVSTAPTYAQVNKILWEEIRKHHASAKLRGMPMPGYVTQGDEWKSDTGQILGFGRKPATGDRHGFHGIHRRYVLVILDEACGVPEEIWTGVEAITTTEGCRILAIGNPDDRNTEFGNNFLREDTKQDWHRISIPASSTPNFTGEPVPKLLNEVLVSKAWCEERLRAWGEKDPRYIAKVLAEFPDVSKSSLFPPSVVSLAFDEDNSQPIGSVVKLGVDVARFGTDKNVVVSYAGVSAQIEDVWTGTDTVSSAHKVIQIAEDVKTRLKAPWVEIRVDAVGLGAGVVDTLNARAVLEEKPWFSVYEMHGSASPPADVGGSVHGYGNARAYWFDQLRQSMRNGRVQIGHKPDFEQHREQLKDDLAIVFYHFRQGRLFIMSKDEMRKLHGRSPDYADALAYATAPVAEGLPAGSTVTETASDMVHSMNDFDDFGELSISPF